MFLFPRIPAELLMGYPVTPKMNRATFNEPEAIQRLEPNATIRHGSPLRDRTEYNLCTDLFRVLFSNLLHQTIDETVALASIRVRDVARSVYGKIVALLASIVFLTIVAYIVHFFS
jgi:hypothetical protein